MGAVSVVCYTYVNVIHAYTYILEHWENILTSRMGRQLFFFSCYKGKPMPAIFFVTRENPKMNPNLHFGNNILDG